MPAMLQHRSDRLGAVRIILCSKTDAGAGQKDDADPVRPDTISMLAR